MQAKSNRCALCTECSRNNTAEGICVPCQEGWDKLSPLSSSDDAASRLSEQSEEKQGNLYHLDRHRDRDVDGDRDRDRDEPPSLRDGVQGLGLGVTSRTEEEFAELLAAYRRGELKPVPVELGEMLPHFGAKLREISDDMELLYGLRLAEGEDRALPYPASRPKSLGLVKDKREASKLLRRLVNAGVWKDGSPLPKYRRGGALFDGTKTYVPGGKR
jgi:hypothetical protein